MTDPGKPLASALFVQVSGVSRDAHTDAFTRRRQAAHRLEPHPCGCRDPWSCTHRLEESGEAQLDAAEAAKHHLSALGLPALLPAADERALRRRQVRRRVIELASA